MNILHLTKEKFLITLLACALTAGSVFAAVSSSKQLEKGKQLFAEKNYDAAIADFNKVLESFPNEANTYNSRGLVYREKGQYEAAIADFNRALAIDPNLDAAYNSRGAVYFDKKQYDAAIRMI